MNATNKKFSALATANKLADILGDNSERKFSPDQDGNGTNGDPAARAYGYVWVTATNGYRDLVWLDITSQGISFRVSKDWHPIVCPNGLTCAEIVAFMVSEVDRENIGVPSATYIRRQDSRGYRPGAIESGQVRIIEDQHPIARVALAGYWQSGSNAYPLGFSVKVENGFITGGSGSI